MTFLLRRCSGWGLKEWLFAVYLLALPLMDYAPCKIFGRLVLLSDIIFVVLAFTYFFELISRKSSFSFDLFDYSGLMMFGLYAFSLLNAPSPVKGLQEFAVLGYLYLLFFIVRRLINTKERFIDFLTVWVMAAFIASIIGLAAFIYAYLSGRVAGNQFLFYTPIEAMAHHFPRIDSTFINANMFLSYLHIAICAAIILYLLSLSSGRQKRFFHSVVIVILIITAFLAGSRRFTGLLLSLILINFWYFKGKIAKSIRVLLILGFVFFFIVSVFTTIWTIFPVSINTSRPKGPAIKVNTLYSLHMMPITASFSMIKQHPFFGIGLGRFNSEFSRHVDWDWVKSSFGLNAYPQCEEAVNKRTLNFDPHSAYFGSLAETGIVGFTGLLVFFGTALFLFIRNLKKHRGDKELNIIIGCQLACLIGFFLNAITLDVLTMRHFWLLIALPVFL